MPQATLAVSLPESNWIHEVSTAHPATDFEVVAALAGEDSGIVLLDVTTDDLSAVFSTIENQSEVTTIDLLRKEDDAALVQVATTSPPLVLPLWKAGIPVTMPFTVRDGTATGELTTSSERLSDLGSYLENADIGYEIEYTSDDGTPDVDRLLTDRQREVLLTALDAGYYAVPREATLTDVAHQLEISKATCSDLLHRAEHSVLTWFANEYCC